MSFREKSAWLMALLMTAAGTYYFYIVRGASKALGETAPPAIVTAFVILVVVSSVIAQIVLALSSPKEANAPADERERMVQQRAGNWSGYVLATGAVAALGHFLVYSDGNMLFHLVMASLIVAQIAEYAFQDRHRSAELLSCGPASSHHQPGTRLARAARVDEPSRPRRSDRRHTPDRHRDRARALFA